DVVVGEVAAPGGGGVGAGVQLDENLNLALGEHGLGKLLGEGDARAVFADGYAPGLGGEAHVDLVYVDVGAGVADGAEDAALDGVGAEHGGLDEAGGDDGLGDDCGAVVTISAGHDELEQP